MANVNIEKSRQYADMIRAQPKECYKNSAMVLLAVDDEVLTYVEGTCELAGTGLLFKHGWLEDENGDIIDVTEHRFQRLPGSGFTNYTKYFTWTQAEVEALMSSEGMMLPLAEFSNNEEMKKTWRSLHAIG